MIPVFVSPLPRRGLGERVAPVLLLTSAAHIQEMLIHNKTPTYFGVGWVGG
jgi:hypothetical protein